MSRYFYKYMRNEGVDRAWEYAALPIPLSYSSKVFQDNRVILHLLYKDAVTPAIELPLGDGYYYVEEDASIKLAKEIDGMMTEIAMQPMHS